jgi:hypothetical protein
MRVADSDGVIRIGGVPAEPTTDSLRERAATALEGALGFVKAHGDTLALGRAHVILGAEPAEGLVERVANRIANGPPPPLLGLAEGGEPGLAAELERGLDPELLVCLEALVLLSDLESLHADCVEPIAERLLEAREADGSFGDSSLPAEMRIFTTGLLAGLLGRTRVVRPELLDDAGDFLAGQWSPERVEGRAWEPLTAFGVFFSSVGHDLSDEVLQWVGRELERGYRTRVYDAASTLRVMMLCDATAMPGSNIAPDELLHDLLREQGEDGGFAELSPAGPGARISPTIDSMLGIIRLSRLL